MQLSRQNAGVGGFPILLVSPLLSVVEERGATEELRRIRHAFSDREAGMRFIPTRIHAVLDYLVGVLLIIVPWLLGFAEGGAETWVPVILGVGIIVYSLCTNYEFSAVRSISMPAHLWMDGIGGAILLVSPWLFGFADEVWIPHVVVGLIEIGAAVCTHTAPPWGPVVTPEAPGGAVDRGPTDPTDPDV